MKRLSKPPVWRADDKDRMACLGDAPQAIEKRRPQRILENSSVKRGNQFGFCFVFARIASHTPSPNGNSHARYFYAKWPHQHNPAQKPEPKEGISGVKFGRFAVVSAATLLLGLEITACRSPNQSVQAVVKQVASESAPPASTNDACAKLVKLTLDQVEIASAKTYPAGALVDGAVIPDPLSQGPGTPVAGLPAFCRVIGHIHPEAGSDIKFETWMPSANWDGRLNGAGNGGFAGSIYYPDLAAAVNGGQSGVSTDTGHTGIGIDASWAKGHPERIRDYGWRAVHLSAVAAKELIVAFYGRNPDHSYFMSCSNGGRQALMEASRFPDDYDGVLAGAPAADYTNLIMSMINTVQAQLPPGATIRSEQASLLKSEVLKQCDALDGQIDGLVSDPRVCKLDVTKLACGVSNSKECFAPAQLVALKKIYAGPHDSSGRRVAPGYPPSGAEVGNGWNVWIFSGALMRSLHTFFPDAVLKDFVPHPFADTASFNFDTDPVRLRSEFGRNVNVPPGMQQFFDRGGKLILWHGWADAAIPPEATLEFRQAILRASGPQAKNSMRLFMVPGLQHCVGGTGPVVFGQVSPPPPDAVPERNIAAALQAWVEKGRVPDSVVGRKGMTMAENMGAMLQSQAMPSTRSERLICAYPAKAMLRPGADPEQASSYSCRSRM